MHGLLVFGGVAVLVTLTPGPATATVVRSALRGGRRDAFRTTLGNSVGVLFWGCASAVGISALVAASEVAFTALRAGGAIVLVWLGIQSFRHARRDLAPPVPRSRKAFRDGLVTSLANPKLAVFFVALFPQFIPKGDSVLPTALGMAALIVALDLVWYSIVAFAVTLARGAVAESRWPARLERLTGSVLVGLGLRLAIDAR